MLLGITSQISLPVEKEFCESKMSTMSKFHQSFLKRMRTFNMKTIFHEARHNNEIFSYFPDSCQKKYPPREYFWAVYATLEQETFSRLYNQEMNRVRRRIRRPQTLQMSAEHVVLMAQRQNENLNLLNRLRQTGVERNITYLRRQRRNVQPVRGPIDQFLNPTGPIIEQQIFHEEE